MSGSGRRSARERTLAVAFASAQTVAQKLDETLRPLMKKYGVTALKPGGMDMRTPTLVVYAGGLAPVSPSLARNGACGN